MRSYLFMIESRTFCNEQRYFFKNLVIPVPMVKGGNAIFSQAKKIVIERSFSLKILNGLQRPGRSRKTGFQITDFGPLFTGKSKF